MKINFVLASNNVNVSYHIFMADRTTDNTFYLEQGTVHIYVLLKTEAFKLWIQKNISRDFSGFLKTIHIFSMYSTHINYIITSATLQVFLL